VSAAAAGWTAVVAAGPEDRAALPFLRWIAGLVANGHEVEVLVLPPHGQAWQRAAHEEGEIGVTLTTLSALGVVPHTATAAQVVASLATSPGCLRLAPAKRRRVPGLLRLDEEALGAAAAAPEELMSALTDAGQVVCVRHGGGQKKSDPSG